MSTLTERRGFDCDGNWTPPSGDADDGGDGPSRGELFGIILLVLVVIAGAVLGWMRWKNRHESKAGRPPKYPAIARCMHSSPRKSHGNATVTGKKTPQLAPKQGHRGFHLGLHHIAVPDKHGPQPLAARSTS